MLIIGLVAAQEVCCEQTKGGAWCESVPESECKLDARQASTSCDETYYCQLGTCIDTDRGTCTSTRKVICDNAPSGHFESEDKDDILMCQNGCCLIGEDVAFVTQTECKQLALDYGIDINFREDIKDQENCFALASPKEKGACVSEEDYVKNCIVTTRDNCPEHATFHAGLLCTASGISDCGKSKNTKCNDDKVYFLDSCGNLANVYDEKKYDENNYWTYIQEPECNVIGADEECGNCIVLSGSICRKYKPGVGGMPDSGPEYGDYVCRDLGCYEGNKKIAEHGEGWCAESEGIYPDIPEILNDSTTRAEIENEIKYNLPGSRYYKELCWDGEIIVYECKDKREEICRETDIDGFRIGTCTINKWRFCDAITSKTECEDTYNDCKWISGYRFDREIVEVSKRDEEQGSCVPLYAPGFEFWEPDSEANPICSVGIVQDSAVYETHWLRERNKFEDDSTKDAAERCLENCYLIPDYGSDLNLLEIISFYGGGRLPKNLGDYYLSNRRGHYCTKKNEPDKKKIGEVGGRTIQCAADEDKRRVPLFYQHSQWLDFLRSRTRSMGDCGFTENAFGEPGQPGSELITVIFEILNQKGEVTGNSTAETIYIGNERTTEYRE